MQTIYKDMYEGPSPQTESGPGALLVHLKSEPGISCTVQYSTVQYSAVLFTYLLYSTASKHSTELAPKYINITMHGSSILSILAFVQYDN